jgi:hypothetical protein
MLNPLFGEYILTSGSLVALVRSKELGVAC